MIHDILLCGVNAVTGSYPVFSGSYRTQTTLFSISIWPLLFLALTAIIFVWLSRFADKINKEQKLTRIELGRVAEEVQGLREELKNNRSTNTSNDNDS